MSTHIDMQNANPRQRLFLQSYLASGNATKAYMESYKVPEKHRASAAVLASRLLRKVKDSFLLLLEQNGVDDMAIVEVLKDSFRATRQQVYHSRVYEFPDHYARMKAVELLSKLTGRGAKEDTNMNQLNVQIISDPQKGIFRIEEKE